MSVSLCESRSYSWLEERFEEPRKGLTRATNGFKDFKLKKNSKRLFLFKFYVLNVKVTFTKWSDWIFRRSHVTSRIKRVFSRRMLPFNAIFSDTWNYRIETFLATRELLSPLVLVLQPHLSRCARKLHPHFFSQGSPFSSATRTISRARGGVRQ